MVDNRLKMKGYLFFFYPVLSSAVSSLSTGREGEEGEYLTNNKE